jgi:tetratricopeptide (TPR) repeat protein
MSPQRYIFRQKQRWYSSPLLIFSLSALIISGLFVTQGYRRGEVKPLFLPTPTATRIASSFSQEAEMQFQSGNLDAAIASYQEAITINPDNGLLYAELARILTYSTESQTTDKEKEARFSQAVQAAEKATQLAPEDSTVFAVYAFALDWDAGFIKYIQGNDEAGSKMLTQAEQVINKALTLDENNVFAQVTYAEVLIDQQRFEQAKQAIDRALKLGPNMWEAHRVYALYLENQADYMGSIEELQTALKLAQNMTFLYIRLGQSYRSRGLSAWKSPALSTEYYTQAIEYFDKAAQRNEQLGIKDPLPYLGIGRAYAQIGEFFSASRNMNKALQFDPTNPEVYAQLGMVYRQARNYEDAISALKCGVRGCSDTETCALRSCNPDVDPPITITGMPLSSSTLVYYYTYASLLAGMYLPYDPARKNYCTDAISLISEVRASSFASDPIITGILDESAAICQNMTSGAALPTATPEGKATPTPIKTPTILPSPKPPKNNSGG